MAREHSTAPVPSPIEHELNTAYNAGYQKVLHTLGSARYYQLLDELEGFRDHPPVKSRASRPARKPTRKLVNRTAKRFLRSQKDAARSKQRPSYDATLHQVRTDAKRLPHAAESVTAIHGKLARRMD
ncbi:CHAD domain-containing protein [Arthrobacter sp. ISL-30]|uniref:CHAD domain-containing protein n=1 Tax=Arthrobacter sp. ISL-30 TaxID=2819109 RepID=UPI001BE514B7|nr:CHAD domain-containing protein [Arthrobacter sp. ISL-30]